MRSALLATRIKRCASRALLFSSCFPLPVIATGQGDIRLSNPSFESKPRIGIDAGTAPIEGWTDCGLAGFPGTSPPDIHPLPNNPWYDAASVSGKTYLGLVCRSNLTWESLSQILASPMEEGACYRFTCSLISLPDILVDLMDSPRAAILRIWGGSATCGRGELLGRSPALSHREWREYTFHLRPSQSWTAITLEAWYSTGEEAPHSGHLLVDAASALIRTDPATAPRGTIATVDVQPGPARQGNTPGISFRSGQPTIGRRIRMESLHFAMDSAELPPHAWAELETVYQMLREHPGMRIEIGGHTNTVPADAYCDALSLARAEAVRQWLLDRGIAPDRLLVRGYGKREPIIRYDAYSRAGRRRNQRVEIRVLSL